MSGSLGLTEHTFATSHKKRLGEGATYVVEEREIVEGQDLMGPVLRYTDEDNNEMTSTYTLVAVKRAKFMFPRAANERIAPGSEVHRKFQAVLAEMHVHSNRFTLQSDPRVVRLLGFAWDKDSSGSAPVLVMELATYGSLNQFHSPRDSFND